MEFAIIIQAIDTTTTLYSATKRISSNIKMSKLDSKIFRWSHLYGVCLPRFAGKSDLVRRFKSKEVMFFDIDAITLASFPAEKQAEIRAFRDSGAETSYVSLVFPAARKLVSELAASFADKKIVLVSSHIDLLKFCGVMKCNRLVLKPSSHHYRTIPKPTVTDLEAERVLSDYASENGARINKVYESFESLHRIIMEKFKVILKA
jgi:hypothetical protein